MQPSIELLKLATEYLAIVDSGDESRQGEERTLAHDALLDQMEKERIPFNARYVARWIARWMLKGSTEPNVRGATVMFARLNKHNGVPEQLYFNPPDDNKEGLTPVVMVLLPFTFQPFVTERNT